MPCSKGMKTCRTDCQHREFIETYYAARDSALQQCERVCLGYETEHRDCEIPTLKDFLVPRREVAEQW